MPAKWVFTWHTTSLCLWSECMPGTQTAYANDVRECMPGVPPADASEVKVCLIHMPSTQPAYVSEVWSECMSVCFQLMPAKWVHTWHTTSLCQWSECMPGTQPAYASDVRECMPGVLPADTSEVRVCLIHNQHMPVKCAYACFTTSFCQWSACMAGMITAYASEVSLCLVCYQLMMPVKWIYTWYVTSLFQWS